MALREHFPIRSCVMSPNQVFAFDDVLWAMLAEGWLGLREAKLSNVKPSGNPLPQGWPRFEFFWNELRMLD